MSHVESLAELIPPAVLVPPGRSQALKSIVRTVVPLGFRHSIRNALERMHTDRGCCDASQTVQIEMNGITASFSHEGHWSKRHSCEGFEGDYGRLLVDTIMQEGPESVFMDIGAAEGYYPVFAAVAGSHVVAIEPDPELLCGLQRNVYINGIQDRVTVLPIAVSDHAGTATLYTDGNSGHAPSLADSKLHSHSIAVEMDTIDHLVLDLKSVPSPNIIKIDVEGAEGLVLEGARRLLSSGMRPTHVFIELHCLYLPHFGSTAQDVYKTIVDEFGYQPVKVYMRGTEALCYFTLPVDDGVET